MDCCEDRTLEEEGRWEGKRLEEMGRCYCWKCVVVLTDERKWQLMKKELHLVL